MTAKCHRDTEELVLDAARDRVLAVGVRRTTLTDVARRAGLSRMTVYRRWPDIRTLVGDVMTREWVAVAAGTAPARDHPEPVCARLVDGLLDAVRTFRRHPLLRKILDVDPELLLPYLVDRRGTSQDHLLEILEDTLRRGHEDGSVRRAHPVRQARTLLLLVQPFALSLTTMTDAADPELTEASFDDELRTILERTLRP